jgi:hypothetical protein
MIETKRIIVKVLKEKFNYPEKKALKKFNEYLKKTNKILDNKA